MTPEQRNRLADLVVQWEDLYRQGQDTPVDVLCKNMPALVDTLARHIAALKRVAWLDKKLEDDGDDPPDGPSDKPRSPKVLAGRYRLDELIATGGFAEVWRAFDLELQRIIAVKIPKRTVVGSAESFLAEARRVARLKHPAILPVYDVGVDDGECFFVSEFVEGGSLADRLTKGGIPIDQVCRWLSSIAEALDHAHTNGVIHRDVKPANILIDGHDRALLADFGIAQSSMKTGEFAPSLGTLRYMSPEQLNGESAVPQSDIYSLGVVLHEALTGKPPYSSDEPNTLRMEINSGASVSRDLAQLLVPACRKALQKDPGQRFASAGEFAAALRTSPKPKSWLLPLGTIAALGCVTFLVLRPNTGSTPTIPVESQPATTPSPRPVIQAPANRTMWIGVSSNVGKKLAFDSRQSHWIEYTPDGYVFAYFDTVEVTPAYVHIVDRKRNLGIRLYSDHCDFSPSNDFVADSKRLWEGRWASDPFGDLPAQFYDRITLILGPQILARYTQALSEAIGVHLVLDKDALAKINVSVDQVVDLNANNETASLYLERLLTSIDPEGRLTLSSTTTTAGNPTVIITTKPGQ
jgi:serine/threonine protein kinase